MTSALLAETTSAPATHPRLDDLVRRARERAADAPQRIALVYPCDSAAIGAAARIIDAQLALPVLVGPRAAIAQAALAAGIDIARFEIVDTAGEPGSAGGPRADAAPAEAARRAVALAREGSVSALMKGALHTDELMSAVVDRETGLRGARRISHVFLFDLPRYPKLLGLADCVVNIAPDLRTKHEILGNAVGLLQRLGIAQPKVGILAAVEWVNPAIPATLDAQALVDAAKAGAWPGALVEGPCGFDNAICAKAARIKKMESQVSGDADLLVVPDLNAGNMLYKSFNYVGGGECAGLVLGARVPIVLTSRSDSLLARIASVALAVLAMPRAR
ncbi:bifunctional enoyl-CoA hydratase/phosphate acetyltransferase [Verminephrobacter aporrectodeae]|uniref:bifunctional enoyl-CoA hydratase/phosphate acetyltransferase n=2 Tax=Verminephrobacter aporrectodeae TaxID=1110389 RepID=UPI002244B690|nr:bifunctional enoyl-CoA hydratase/phosphate acetyltransferase [Verminephrobacter aporrectodeae]MCW8165880.1 bifunctional enoyl-CoA hydratase/phosphate acetyltransferase [Verminephrobacter aporrectodeae subsp. tuberculatae]MCW8170082.1 bifunctional enoyl-CoA hydratase/phosphate acetyltransferase [Verminephrobacter aporrectodeae subsp. tuberculatae]MCW8174130.1 bifunctional enoyl-CoA hydratase/phosphate acetyltransferase [Verminephrobacter aporrectodeae subsp. tuberculatae]MCW8197390.1 bifuncti